MRRGRRRERLGVRRREIRRRRWRKSHARLSESGAALPAAKAAIWCGSWPTRAPGNLPRAGNSPAGFANEQTRRSTRRTLAGRGQASCTAPTAPPDRTGMGFKHHHQSQVGASIARADSAGRAHPTLPRKHRPAVSNGPRVEARCSDEADGLGAICDVERRPACGMTTHHRGSGWTRRACRGLDDSRRGSPTWSRPRARTTTSRPAAAVAMPIATI